MTTIDQSATTQQVDLRATARQWVNPTTGLMLASAVQDGDDVTGWYYGTATTGRVSASEMVPLPVGGEHINVLGQVSGWFLGITPGSVIPATETAVVEVFDGREVVSTRVPISGLHACNSVDAPRSLTPIAQRMVEALVEATLTRYRITREHEQWVDSLVADMHEAADDANLCEDFDDFMEAHDLEPRTREREVAVTASLPVTVTVTARDDDAAEDQIEVNPELARAALVEAARSGAPLDVTV